MLLLRCMSQHLAQTFHREFVRNHGRFRTIAAKGHPL
jgi:hypothetical protein